MLTKTLLPTGRCFLQKASVTGTLRAAIIGPTTGSTVADTLRVVFWDATGKTAVWPLVNVSNNCQEACCCLIQDRLIVSSRPQASGADFSKTVVTEFRLPADAFTSAPAFALQLSYGDNDSRGSELVKFQSGEVISVTYQHTDMRVCAAMRSVSGSWTSQGMFTLSPETGTAHLFSCAAAPWSSNELWVFDNLDGGTGCCVGIFNTVGGKLMLTSTIPVFIKSRLTDGYYYWNGELVDPVATTDFKRSQICLSYTNTLWPPNTNQVAYPVVVAIKQDRVPVGIITGTEGVCSIKNKSPICVTDAGVVLNYRAGAPKANTLVVGTNRIEVRDGLVAWNEYAQEFIYAQPDTTDPNTFKVVPGPVVLTTLGGPTPIPPPTVANIVESPLSDLSWSGADPTNAGLFMLQSAPSKDGPWTNITDRWNVQVQNLNPKQQTGEVLKVGNTFYRLNPKA